MRSLQAGLGLLGTGKAGKGGLGVPALVAGVQSCGQYVVLCTPGPAKNLSAKGEGFWIGNTSL